MSRASKRESRRQVTHKTRQKVQDAFRTACALFDARIVDAMHQLLDSGQLFSAAILCAVAIDVFADTKVSNGVATPIEYKALLRSWFGGYGDYGDRFYAVLRSGLIHRLDLTDRSDRIGTELGEGPIAFGSGDQPPRLKGDFLIIDVPHLIGCFDRVYNRFKENPGGPLQRNFAQRLKQQEYVELSDRLVSKGEYSGEFVLSSAPVSGSVLPEPLSEFGFVDRL